MRAWFGPASAATVGIAWLLAHGVAHAEEPVELDTGQITDRVDALGDRRDEVQDALDQLFSDHQLQLFVVYVDSFSGQPSQDWADETARINGLGLNDALLTVATGDRQYAYSVDEEYPLTDAQLAEVATEAIEPPLREDDWAGAAIGAAEGYASALDGGGIPWIPVAVIGGVGVVGAYAFLRARRGRERGAGPSAGADPARLTTDELDKRASSLLVETDDAIKTSEQEVGFATAQFGEAAAAPFAAVLEEARGELTASFRLRQRLDDAEPEDDATRRSMLAEIISRCEAANAKLDDQAEDFDRLRDLERNAPQVLAEVEQRAEQARARVVAAQGTLQTLGGRFTESALAAVTSNGGEATERLTFAAESIAAAKQRIEAGETAGAAVSVLAAEEAVDQAGQLLDAVDRLAAALEQASAGLQNAVQETTQDLAEAKALLAAGDQHAGDLAGLVAAAEQALTSVQQEMAAGRFDPIASIRRIEEADGGLDQALAGVRDRQQRAQRARASLEQAVLAARSEISATHDFITTRRGAVGGEARTRLAEAQRQLDQAMHLAESDPESALARAQQADALAEQAGQLARADVGAYSTPGGGGMFGGGGGLGGAILGGILIDSMLGGGRRGGFGGGFGGGGGFGRAPGSFGGGGTRGRRGGGGRF
jgi:tetratricopeptide (TPR) repeat protein